MIGFAVLIEPKAIDDMQKAINYYDEKQVGLGLKFERCIHDRLKLLEMNPFFQIRYKDVHCLPLKKFPFMVHFTIDEIRKLVIVRAVFHTSLNPQKWKKRE